MTTDELAALTGNAIIPRKRRSAAIASQRRTASEIGKLGTTLNDDDSDEEGEVWAGLRDGEVGGATTGTSAQAAADGESDDEAELEF